MQSEYKVSTAAALAAMVLGGGELVGPSRTRALARRGRPGRSRRFGVSRTRAMPGAWGGDGSVGVMTRQRRRKAVRVEAKRSRRKAGR